MSMKHNEEIEKILCHNCLEPNEVNADFCSKCRTPLSSYVTLDPFKQIESTGNTLAKATRNPKLISVVGIWLFFGSQNLILMFPIYLALSSIIAPETIWNGEDFVEVHCNLWKTGGILLFLLLLFFLYSIIIFKVTRNYLNKKKVS